MGLDGVEGFLNTLDERSFVVHGRRRVGSDSLAEWLDQRGLGEGELATALELRTVLRQALTDGAALIRFPLHLASDESGKLRLVAATGVAVLDGIVETVATSVADGSWKRLKLCAADDCHWAFYDTSRNGGGRWCSMEVCGNRAKTRAYRVRRAG